MRYGLDDNIESADVILVVDCDVPWVNTRCLPKKYAKILHIDVDPLKQQMPVFYIDAQRRYRADACTAIGQIRKHIESTKALSEKLNSTAFLDRWSRLEDSHQKKIRGIEAEAVVGEQDYFDVAYLCNRLRKACPEDTIWVVEAVTNSQVVADQLQVKLPGSWLNCGGGGLGWSGGAVSLAVFLSG